MNRYNHRRMTSEELSRALKRLKMTVGDLMFISGATRWTITDWLAGKGDVPHWVPVLLSLLHLNGAWDEAERVSSERILSVKPEKEKQL